MRAIPSIDPRFQHRCGTLHLSGEPGDEVQVEQLRHAFQFGTAGGPNALFGESPAEEQERSILREYFNTFVPGNVFKWRHMEPEPGKLRYEAFDRCLEWCKSNGYDIRGHCIFYSTDIHIQQWIQDLDDEGLRSALERRARAVASRYRGRVPEYDLSNEILDDVDYFQERLGESIVRDMARWVKDEDPQAKLYLNEHDILTGGDLDQYIALIERMLDLGVPIDGIGCQGHFDAPVDLRHVEEALDRLAAFGLPIKVTEFDIGIPLRLERYRGVSWIRDAWKHKDLAKYQEIVDSYGATYQQEKAAALRQAYELFFAHPAVQGVIMWGFWERSHWRGRGELWQADFTPWPAGEAYMDLVRRQWWLDGVVALNGEGQATIPVYRGRYRISGSRGSPVEVAVHRPGDAMAVRVGG